MLVLGKLDPSRENLYVCILVVYMASTMVQTMVVTTRIKKEIKETLERAGVSIPNAIREHLEELAWRLQLKEEIEGLIVLLQDVKPSESGFALKSVAEDRESH